MPPRKRPRPTVAEYHFDSDSDESHQPKAPLASVHRHTHVESINGRIITEQMLYSMPSSPVEENPPIIGVQEGSTDSAFPDSLDTSDNFLSEGIADPIEGNINRDLDDRSTPVSSGLFRIP